ncbi:UNKNOWN [Stylonychia lemnae]|uniref:YHYH domain-containing protein n=1 Tax=Stylonychia lemnae TaxID=5949 RepID=A0A078BC41_STYLE|nr:UNKNOWN [Stylonychia lemnae]|eukprot:CDW90817.1 UNKNOWN [Stylonychia lemnae]
MSTFRTNQRFISKSAAIALIALGLIKSTVSRNEATPITDSLKDCNMMIRSFEGTYYPTFSASNDIYPYGGTQRFEVVTCSNLGVCPDTVSRTTCSWQRYYSLQCAENQGQTSISAYTNSLPNHCYWGTQYQPYGSRNEFSYYSFSFKFNLPPRQTTGATGLTINQAYYQTTVESQADIDLALCDPNWARTAIIDGAISNTEALGSQQSWTINTGAYPLLRLPSSDQIVGISRNGVFIFSGANENGYDSFFPQAYGVNQNPVKNEFDHCLGLQNTFNTYRYVMFSPCMYDISLRKEAVPCILSPSCNASVIDHAQLYAPRQIKTVLPIGFAKDGRVIYGPYRQDGNLWQPCDVDVCNGRMFGDFYGYVATMFHPYMVGCWGPGNSPNKLTAGCTANPRLCTQATYVNNFMAASVFGILFLFALF